MRKGLTPLIQLRNLLIVLAAIAGFFALTACSYLTDQNNKNEARKLNMGDTACIQDTKKIITGYIKGTESLKRVDDMFECVLRAVNTFTSRTSGEASADGYTYEELNQFLLEYFKDSDGVTSKLLSVGFEIKSTAVGGKKNNITRAEIEKLKGVIVDLQKGIHEIDPHLTILLGRASNNLEVDPKELEAAVHALNNVADSLSARFEGSDGTSIQISRIFELAKMLHSSDDDAKLALYTTIASNLKSIFISGADDKIRCDEWGTVIQVAAKMYGAYIRYQYGLKNQSVGEGNTVDIISPMMTDVLQLLQDAVKRSDNQMIAAVKLKELLSNFEKVAKLEHPDDPLPLGIQLSSLDSVYSNIFTNVLRSSRINLFIDTSESEKNRELGIGTTELAAFSYYVQNWIFGLKAANELLQGKDARPLSALNLTLTNYLRDLDSKKPTSTDPEYRKWFIKRLVTREYQVILNQNLRPLTYVKLNTPRTDADCKRDPKCIVAEAPVVGGPDKDPEFTLRDLLRLNSRRLTVEVVLRSFALDMNRARSVSGLTTDEAETIYQSMREIGFDLGVSDPRSQKAGNRTFMEANLFTSNSNGDNYIGYREGVEWFDFATASGKHAIEILNGADQQWIDSKTAPAGSEFDLDVFGRVKVDITAFRNHLKDNFSRYFSDLPGMAAYVEQLKRENKYQAFEVALENAARPIGHVASKMDSSAVRTLVPILYYTESIFTRFDKNHSGLLENDEAWEIFPIMKNTIRDVSNGVATTESTQKMVFARLLLTGEPPPDNWKKYVETPVDWLKEKWFRPSIDRLGIINLIAAIANTARQNSLKAIMAIYDVQKDSLPNAFARGEAVILDQLHELSRCSPSSQSRFRQVMQQSATRIFQPVSAGKFTSDTFVNRVQWIIQHDVQASPTPKTPPIGLSEQCQPMLQIQ